MIQRIQTIYLLAVSAAMTLMLSLPLGRFLIDDHEFVLTAFNFGEMVGGEVTKIASTVYMGILIVMAAVLPFLTIFFYKNRVFQIRMCFVEIVFLAGVQIFAIYYLYHATTTVNAMGMSAIAKSYSWINVLPVVAIILTWLANKRIIKDEALVRSMNRIR